MLNCKKLLPFGILLVQTMLEIAFYKIQCASLIKNGTSNSPFLVILWVLNFIHLFWAFSAASFMDPGYIHKILSNKEINGLDEEIEKLVCDKCVLLRPHRAHHCSVCKKCVAVKDHHCIFMGNCVGIRNCRAFTLFLILFVIHSLFSMYISIQDFRLSGPTASKIIIAFITHTYYIVFGIIIITQFPSFFVSLIKNETPAEKYFTASFTYRYTSSYKCYFSKYDTGSVLENLKQRLGNPFLWLIPLPNNDFRKEYPINPKYTSWVKLISTKEK